MMNRFKNYDDTALVIWLLQQKKKGGRSKTSNLKRHAYAEAKKRGLDFHQVSLGGAH